MTTRRKNVSGKAEADPILLEQLAVGVIKQKRDLAKGAFGDSIVKLRTKAPGT